MGEDLSARAGCGLMLLLAGLPPAAATEASTWQGFYVGGELGGGWSDTDWQYTNANWYNTLGPVVVGRDFGIGDRGVIGGGQAGYNYQTGPWVLGVEATVSAADLGASRISPFFPVDVYSFDIDWLTTVTGRAGYAVGPWLGYAKAGWAGAEVNLTLFDRGTPVRASSGTWANGWTVGGGGEYDFGGGISFGLEYVYVDLDTDNWTITCPTCPSGVGGGVPKVDGDIVVQSVMGRVNYRFGGD